MIPDEHSPELRALLKKKLRWIRRSDEECHNICADRILRFRAWCVGQSHITGQCEIAISLTEASRELSSSLGASVRVLVGRLRSQTLMEYAIFRHECATGGVGQPPALPLGDAELRQKAYEFLRSAFGPAGAARVAVEPELMMQDQFDEYFSNETEVRRDSISNHVGLVVRLLEARAAERQMAVSFAEIAQIYRSLLCFGIWEWMGSAIQRKERADKLREAAVGIAGETPIVGFLIHIAELAALINSWVPNHVPDSIQAAQEAEEYLASYIRVLREWLSIAEGLRKYLEDVNEEWKQPPKSAA